MSLFDRLLASPFNDTPSWVLEPPAATALDRIDGGPFRVYVDENGNRFPSVTSVLSHGSDHSWLKEWRDRVGHDKADAISERSRLRGTRMHSVLEDALASKRSPGTEFDENKSAQYDAEAVLMARSIATTAFKSMTNVRASELMLSSIRLRIAGTIDCVSDWNGTLSIVDFKNSRRLKTAEDIGGYFLQTTLYALMYADNFGQLPSQLIILMAYGDDRVGRCDVFVEQTKKWIEPAVRLCQDFKRSHPNI